MSVELGVFMLISIVLANMYGFTQGRLNRLRYIKEEEKKNHRSRELVLYYDDEDNKRWFIIRGEPLGICQKASHESLFTEDEVTGWIKKHTELIMIKDIKALNIFNGVNYDIVYEGNAHYIRQVRDDATYCS